MIKTYEINVYRKGVVRRNVQMESTLSALPLHSLYNIASSAIESCATQLQPTRYIQYTHVVAH